MKRGIITKETSKAKEFGKDMIGLAGGLLVAGTMLIALTDKIGKTLFKEKDEEKDAK